MHIDELEKIIEVSQTTKEINRNVSNMKLSAIFRKLYLKFDGIRSDYQFDLTNEKSEFGSYSKEIKHFLTMAGKFQKNGNPISESQILLEMYREKTRRENKGIVQPKIDTQSNTINSPNKTKSPVELKVSPKNNKKVVALNNGEITPIKIDNMAKAIHILKGEIQLYKKEGAIPIWNGNDEFQFLEYKRLANLHKVSIFHLEIKNVLLPMFTQEVKDYYFLWTSKAKICEKIFSDS